MDALISQYGRTSSSDPYNAVIDEDLEQELYCSIPSSIDLKFALPPVARVSFFVTPSFDDSISACKTDIDKYSQINGFVQ